MLRAAFNLEAARRIGDVINELQPFIELSYQV